MAPVQLQRRRRRSSMIILLVVVVVGGMLCFVLLHRHALADSNLEDSTSSSSSSSSWMAIMPEEQERSVVSPQLLRSTSSHGMNGEDDSTTTTTSSSRMDWNQTTGTFVLNGTNFFQQKSSHHQHPEEEQGGQQQDKGITTRKNDHKDTTTSNNEFFGACLLIMDDNHYLIEWLAYHYIFLPLRKLIVAIDPKSTTSPRSILNRYQNQNQNSHNLINITIWNDTDFFPIWRQQYYIETNKSIQMYLRRQEYFHLACLREMKKSQEQQQQTTIPNILYNSSSSSSQSLFSSSNKNDTANVPPIWVALVDTDEYITVNHQADRNNRVKDLQPTLYQMLNSPKNRYLNKKTNTACIPMMRLQMATTDSEGGPLEVQQWVPPPTTTTINTTTTQQQSRIWNGTNFITLRYRYSRNPYERQVYIKAKNVLDVSRISYDDLRDNSGNGNPHRPIRTDLCPRKNIFQPHKDSPYVVHHYPGTYEQFTYRNGKEERTVRNEERYMEHNYTYQWSNNNARQWLPTLIEQVGLTRAEELLEGIGQVGKYT